jgi:hypothetical protein
LGVLRRRKRSLEESWIFLRENRSSEQSIAKDFLSELRCAAMPEVFKLSPYNPQAGSAAVEMESG